MTKSLKSSSVGISAFLDILGFGDRVVGAQSEADIQAVLAEVRRIQEHFDFKPKHKHVKENQTSSKKTVLTFSDSIVVNVALKSTMTKLQGTFDPIMSELWTFAIAQGRCVNDGVFLRGGVDLAWWYRAGNLLASESLVRACRMEKDAVVPVIALTEKLYEFLSKHTDREYYSTDIEPVNTLFRRYTSKGPKGEISFWYLDYITAIAEATDWVTSSAQRQACLEAPSDKREHIRELGYRKNLRDWFKYHAKQIRLAHSRAQSESVKCKYEWMAHYHNEIAPRFTPSPRALCKLAKS